MQVAVSQSFLNVRAIIHCGELRVSSPPCFVRGGYSSHSRREDLELFLRARRIVRSFLVVIGQSSIVHLGIECVVFGPIRLVYRLLA